MPELPVFTSVLDVDWGRDPVLDAWLLHFMSENNLGYAMDPDKNASPEQLQFMLALDEDQFYAPCSDWMLLHLLNNRLDPELKSVYNEKWRALVRLTRETVPDHTLRTKIINLCRHKYDLTRAAPIIIPSRLMKRLLTMFLILSGETDPYREPRREANARAVAVMESPRMDALLNECPSGWMGCRRLSELRFELAVTELSRLMFAAAQPQLWAAGAGEIPTEQLVDRYKDTLEGFAPLKRLLGENSDEPMKILYLPDTAGGLMLDVAICKSLLRQGHQVTMALKEGFHFMSPSFWDWESDPLLARALEGAHFLAESHVTKNELLHAQRENRFLVISDGTREEFNPYRVSVTFARAWKEADLILGKGTPVYRRVIQVSHQFTRDVICFFTGDDGRFRLFCKPKRDNVRKFTEKDLAHMAETIISGMRAARPAGKRVTFYSAIVGSIPGQTATAIEILKTFVAWLRQRLDATYIINPAEHFEEGMDADDLMFMWERVQRAGLIDIWRFQTVEDVEKSFELLGKPVSTFWAGKDATFSTGCTKEMAIALEEQRKYPEMQIIGPAPERFFRRREYGVGKFCDAAIECR